MRQRLAFLLAVIAFSQSLAAIAWAEFEYRASVTAAQEYNDNVNETSKPEGDWVSVMSGTVQAIYAGSRLDASVDYTGELRLYDGGKRQDETRNDLEAKATLQVIKDLLVLDASDSNHMVYYNAAKGPTNQMDTNKEQVNQNLAAAGLTLTPRISDRTRLAVGYKVKSSLYDNSDAVDKFYQILSADLMHDLTSRLEAGFSLGYERQVATQGEVSRYRGTVVGRYLYADGCYLFGRFGAVQSMYNNGSNSLKPLFFAGWSHTLGRTIFLLQAQAEYVDNPASVYNSFRTTYSATVTRPIQRGNLAVSLAYSDYSGQDTEHTKDLTGSAQIEYALTQRLTGAASVSVVNSSASHDMTNRYYFKTELIYELPKKTSLKLYYNFKYNDALTRNEQTYHVNILGLALTRSF